MGRRRYKWKEVLLWRKIQDALSGVVITRNPCTQSVIVLLYSILMAFVLYFVQKSALELIFSLQEEEKGTDPHSF
jgi:hypothetical protein